MRSDGHLARKKIDDSLWIPMGKDLPTTIFFRLKGPINILQDIIILVSVLNFREGVQLFGFNPQPIV